MEYVLVKLTKKKNSEGTQDTPHNELPFFFGFRAAGNVIGSFFGGRIIESFGNQFSFKVALMGPVILFICLFVYDEKPVDPNTKPRKNIKQDWVLIKRLFSK
jgi:predicted MFS family arabinose efflux permease